MDLKPNSSYFEAKNIYVVLEDGSELKIKQNVFYRDYIQNHKLWGAYVVDSSGIGTRPPLISDAFASSYQRNRANSVLIYQVQFDHYTSN
jgi:hypothetical protein